MDIYFAPDYGKLCELVDNGQCCEYVLETESGMIRNMFIKRPAPYLVNGVQYYDIVTPYGYGGPVICQANDKETLLEAYRESFSKYCAENNIVCEFIRYHPILCNYADFGSVYQTEYSRHTVGTNLKDYEDPVQSEFSKSARREVRKAESVGVACSVHPHPEDLSVFRVLYEETMDRNGAGAMYYFPDQYYEFLTTSLRDYVLEVRAQYDGEVVASEIYFVAGNIMHAHLLGSSHKLMEIGGGAILEATAARWGRENGYQFIHHGGGRTSAVDDPLYMYKKKFGKNTEFDFYIGKKIWNQAVYDQLVAQRCAEGEITNPGFFPQYRG